MTHSAKKTFHVAARPHLITLHAAEHYRSGSPDERGVVLAQDNRCFLPLPSRETHTHAPPNRPSSAQPVSRLWNSFELAPRANIYQDTTRDDFHSCVEWIERSEVRGSLWTAIRGERIRLSTRDRKERTRRVRRISGLESVLVAKIAKDNRILGEGSEEQNAGLVYETTPRFRARCWLEERGDASPDFIRTPRMIRWP